MPRILTLPCVLLALATAACAGTRPVGVEALAPGMRVRAAPPPAEPVAGYILRRVNGMVGA